MELNYNKKQYGFKKYCDAIKVYLISLFLVAFYIYIYSTHVVFNTLLTPNNKYYIVYSFYESSFKINKYK